MINTVQGIKQLGTILSVWAHPDDETFLAAGILAAAAQNGQTVTCVTATRGEAGILNPQKWPAATLGEVRTKEVSEALKILGITRHHWLDYPDGGCATTNAEAVIPRLLRIIEEEHPDTILTFGPDGWTGHPDHSAVSGWVRAACEQMSAVPVVYHVVCNTICFEKYLKTADERLDIFFNIDKPPLKQSEECDLCLTLSPELRKLKYRALEVMPSQTEIMLQSFDEKFVCDALGTEVFVQSK